MSVERVVVAEVTVRVFHRGAEPEWHKDRTLYGPWQPFEAVVGDEPDVRACGWTPGDALYRVAAFHREQLLRRWPMPGGEVA